MRAMRATFRGLAVFLLLAQSSFFAVTGHAANVQEIAYPARLTVHLRNALPVEGKRGEATAPLTLFFSGWTDAHPAVTARSGNHEIGAVCTSERFGNGIFEETVDLTVDGQHPLESGKGSIALHLKLNGTLASGRFDGSFNGVPVSGWVRAGIAYEVEFPSLGRGLRMWLPRSSQEVRAVLLWGNGASGDYRDAALTPYVQAYAAANRLAVVATSQFGMMIREGEGDLILAALRSFAGQSDHREIENAPILFTGHSNGGQMAYEFNAWMPSRVIAFTVSKGGVYESYDNLSPQALCTPAVLSAGEVDEPRRVEAIRRIFDTNRPKGAPWSLIVEQGQGHTWNESVPLYLVAMQHALDERLDANASAAQRPVQLKPVDPSRAWLADNSTWKSGITAIYPVDHYPGKAKRMKEASWLIDEDAAMIYRGIATYNDPLKLALANNHGPVYGSSEPLVLTCTDFGAGDWKSVKVYDGATMLGEISRDHPTLTVPGPHPLGAHGAVLVGELPDGTLRTSQPVEWIVAPDDVLPENEPPQ